MTTSRFEDALRFWKPVEARQEPPSQDEFPSRWLATGNALPKNHFLITAQSALSSGNANSDDVIACLSDFLSWLGLDANKATCLTRAYEWYQPTPLNDGLVNQLRGLIHGVLSAIHYARRPPLKGDMNEAALMRESDAFQKHAIGCIHAYEAALSIVPVVTRDQPAVRPPLAASAVWDLNANAYADELENKHVPNVDRPHSADTPDDVLRKLLLAARETPPVLTTSGVLMWRRLVSYLIGPAHAPLHDEENADGTFPGAVVFQTKGRVLWASGHSGEVSPITVQLRQEGQLAYYWDPVALGMTLLDDEMIRSVQQAWYLLDQESDRTTSTSDEKRWKELTPKAHTLRIVPVTPARMEGVCLLEGASAGALVGCAMYAAANRWPLNQDTSITATVLDDRGRLGRVHGIKSKLNAAGYAAPKVGAVVLADVVSDSANPRDRSGYDTAERAAYLDQAQRLGIHLFFEPTIKDASKHLLGDHRCEEALRQFAAWQQAKWKIAVEEQDEDRLDRYIIPTYSVLMPRRAIPPSLSGTGQTAPTGIAQHSRSKKTHGPRYRRLKEEVPPEQSGARPDGTALPHLLTKRPWLVLAEDAGAGKTVCTRRAVCWYSSADAWKRLSRGRPLLALRFANEHEESWQALFSGQGNAIDAFNSAVVAQLKTWYEQPHRPVTQQDEAELRRVAEYARTQGRICLILDAMDQTTDTKVLDGFASFLSKSAPPVSQFVAKPSTQPAMFRVRILLTSRLYKIAAPAHAKTFSDGRWGFAKVELFDAARRRLYLADLPDVLRQALVSDEELFAEADDPENDAATFGSPETLKMMREVIEGELLKVQEELRAQRKSKKRG